jgi:hypothetical protein
VNYKGVDWRGMSRFEEIIFMSIIIAPTQLEKLTSDYSFSKNGDKLERKYFRTVIDLFPNCELFWKKFITPLTNRIDVSIIDAKRIINERPSADKPFVDLAIVHYSIFLNLVYAKFCIKNRGKQLSYFENFYSHLGTVIDLADDFLFRLIKLIFLCEKKEIKDLERWTKDEFLKEAEKYYNEQYEKDYNYYLRNAKYRGMTLKRGDDLVKTYFGEMKEFKDYTDFTNLIKPYRNFIVHNIQVGNHVISNKSFVPTKKAMKEGIYKSWRSIAYATPEQKKNDFIDRDLQMQSDLEEIKKHLNNLWYKPIADLNRLLYYERNSVLLNKYDIEFDENSEYKPLHLNMDSIPASGSNIIFNSSSFENNS